MVDTTGSNYDSEGNTELVENVDTEEGMGSGVGSDMDENERGDVGEVENVDSYHVL